MKLIRLRILSQLSRNKFPTKWYTLIKTLLHWFIITPTKTLPVKFTLFHLHYIPLLRFSHPYKYIPALFLNVEVRYMLWIHASELNLHHAIYESIYVWILSKRMSAYSLNYHINMLDLIRVVNLDFISISASFYLLIY